MVLIPSLLNLTAAAEQVPVPPDASGLLAGMPQEPAPSGRDSRTPQGGEEAKPGTPLSGVREFSPGGAGASRNYLVPAFQWIGYGDTNPLGFSRRLDTNRNYFSTYVGTLDLQREGRRKRLNLGYTGGATLYRYELFFDEDTPLPVTQHFHSLSISAEVSWRRWKFLAVDEASYLPESPFGFSGFGGATGFRSLAPAGLGGFGGVAGSAFTPNQTILTGYSRRINNVGALEVEYQPGARSSITVSGVAGTVRFLDSEFSDVDSWALMTGYNHALTRRDTLGFVYMHSLFQFRGFGQEMLNRGFFLSYGHRISGRFSMNLSAGPLLNQFADPAGETVSRNFWSAQGTLQYRGPRTDFSVSVSRALTGGSGVLLGQETRLVQGTVGRQLSRRWYFSLSAGHAYNQSLSRVTILNRRTRYETYQGGALLNRDLGEHFSMFLNYTVYWQRASDPFCIGGGCVSTFTRQVGGVGVSWHGRRIRLD